MKIFLVISLFFIGFTLVQIKSHQPKYRVGDCVDMTAMHITDKGDWDSSGFQLGQFKIVEIIKTDKMNTYMNEKLHAKEFYKISLIFDDNQKEYIKYHKGRFYVIPIEDLDGFRYSTVFWESPNNAKYGCNSYSEKK